MLRFVRILGIALALTGAVPAAAAPPSTRGGLHGIVTGRTDGLGLSSVSITLRAVSRPSAKLVPGPAPFVAMRKTDLEGVFRFDDLPAGLYSIEARINGLEWESFTPILVVPGLKVREHIVLGEDPIAAPPSQT